MVRFVPSSFAPVRGVFMNACIFSHYGLIRQEEFAILSAMATTIHAPAAVLTGTRRTDPRLWTVERQLGSGATRFHHCKSCGMSAPNHLETCPEIAALAVTA